MSMYVVLLNDSQLAEVEGYLLERGVPIYRLEELNPFSEELVDAFQAKLDRVREKYFPESKPVEYRDAVRVLRWAGGNPNHEAIKALIQLSRSFQYKTGTPLKVFGRNLLRLIEGRTTTEIIEWAANERGQASVASVVTRPSRSTPEAVSGGVNGNGSHDPVDRVRRAAKKYAAKPKPAPNDSPSLDDPFSDDDAEDSDL
jgi:hypothetical protein